MSAHVFLNLLNELGKRDKMRGLTRTGNRVNTSSLGFLRFRQGESKACGGLQILLHGVISLPDATSYDKCN